MSQISIKPASSLLSADTLDQTEQSVVKITDVDLILKLQNSNILSQQPIIVVNFDDLATLSLPDFSIVFVQDYGNDGKGSRWWKHPTLGFISSESVVLLKKLTNVFKTTVWNTGDSGPSNQTVFTFNCKGFASNSRIILESIISCPWEDGGATKARISFFISDQQYNYTTTVEPSSGESLKPLNIELYFEGTTSKMIVLPSNNVNSITTLSNIDLREPFTLEVAAKSPKVDTGYMKVEKCNISLYT